MHDGLDDEVGSKGAELAFESAELLRDIRFGVVCVIVGVLTALWKLYFGG